MLGCKDEVGVRMHVQSGHTYIQDYQMPMKCWQETIQFTIL